MEKEKDTTIKSRFIKLDSMRKQHLERARLCASLTIPSLLPPDGTTQNDSLPTPHQSMGARASNNLASKLLLALFPPNSPFFRIGVEDIVLAELRKAMGAEDVKTKVEEQLADRERTIQAFIESESYRVPVFRAFKLLIITGNALLFAPDGGGVKTYRLDQYVCRRDPMGHVLEIITKELVAPEALEKSQVKAKVQTKLEKIKDEEHLELYTWIKRTPDKWEVRQEVVEVEIPESYGTYLINECPWIALRATANEGEDYGRGMVEEYLGDLLNLESLNMAIVEGSLAAAKLLFLCNPNGVTRVEDLKKAPNAGFVVGAEEDVRPLQASKFQDFKTVLETIARIEERLSQAFLLQSSIQRQAERVTAEEIRYMASELEDSLGGVYSILSQELQRPLLARIMIQMKKAGKLPDLPMKAVKLTITTGLEALGRGQDLTKLSTFMKYIEPLGPEVIATKLNVGDYMTRVATAVALDTKGLIKSPEQEAMEMQQQQAVAQQQMMQELVTKAGPGVAQEVTKGVVGQQAEGRPGLANLQNALKMMTGNAPVQGA